MRTLKLRNILATAVLALAAGAAAAAPALPARSTTAQAVTVKVTPRQVQGPVWEFEVAFDTHSQDLDDDLLKTAVLVTPAGNLAPLEWKGPPPGGHHRSGVLRFQAPARAGGPLVLHIRRAGEAAPRVFQWQLQ